MNAATRKSQVHALRPIGRSPAVDRFFVRRIEWAQTWCDLGRTNRAVRQLATVVRMTSVFEGWLLSSDEAQTIRSEAQALIDAIERGT